MGRTRKGLTEAEAALRKEKHAEFFNEELAKPLTYVMHDSNAHDDPKLQDLRDEHGFEALGRWWLLVELLASRVGHCYDVKRRHGWERLAMDLEYGRDEQGVLDCQEFIEVLLHFGLLDRQARVDLGQVRSRRIDRNAEKYAEEVAGRRLGAWVKYNGNASSDT